MQGIDRRETIDHGRNGPDGRLRTVSAINPFYLWFVLHSSERWTPNRNGLPVNTGRPLD